VHKPFLTRLRHFAAEQIKHHYYNITTNGLAISSKTKIEWEQKWKKPSSQKVLMLSPRDYAGSFFRWGKAVNDLDADVVCRTVSLFKHRYNYDFDYIFHAFRRGIGANQDFQRLVDEADTLHIKDEFFFYYHNKFPRVSKFMVDLINEFKKKNKPTIFTFYGSFARKLQGEPAYRKAIQEFDARIALTPDLNYDWFKGYYVPHAFDLSQFRYTWTESKIFAHSPSS